MGLESSRIVVGGVMGQVHIVRFPPSGQSG